MGDPMKHAGLLGYFGPKKLLSFTIFSEKLLFSFAKNICDSQSKKSRYLSELENGSMLSCVAGL